jgi:integrase
VQVGRKSKPKKPNYRPYAVGDFRLGWWRDCFCATWYESTGERRRHRLGVATEEQARTELHAFARAHIAVVKDASAPTIARLFELYVADREGEGKQGNKMRWVWVALKSDFAALTAVDVTKPICRAYWQKRTALGKAPHTVHGELRILRSVLNWAAAEKLIEPVITFWIPAMPDPRDRHLTRAELERLIEAAELPHVRLFIVLAIATAARKTAILELTWDRVDFKRGLIYLHDPERERTNKGRATVPMNSTARAALLEAKAGAVTDNVIEWGGTPIGDIKRAVATAFTRAKVKIKGDGAHVLRHSAAVLMAEAGVPMAEIAQYLGHTDVRTTYRIYARFSPEYLAKAAGALEMPFVHLRASDRRCG